MERRDSGRGGPLAALAWRFQAIRPEDLLPAGDWPAPHLAAGTEPAGTGSVSAGVIAPDGTQATITRAVV